MSYSSANLSMLLLLFDLFVFFSLSARSLGIFLQWDNALNKSVRENRNEDEFLKS